jgi:hypothetical protein
MPRGIRRFSTISTDKTATGGSADLLERIQRGIESLNALAFAVSTQDKRVECGRS